MGAYSVADPGENSPPPHPVYFWTKLRPKGPKKVFLRPPPPFISWSGCPDPTISEGLDLPLLFEVAHLTEYIQ